MLGFALVALLSIYPTIRFVSWNRSFAQHQAPVLSDTDVARIRLTLRLELFGIALILVSAAMMARGVGMMR